MATNTQVVSALQFSGSVPPDRECIRNLTEALQGAVDFLNVVNNVAQVNDGSGTSNAIAQQALQVANLALATAQAAQAAIPQTRSTTEPVSVPNGDSAFPLVWTPAMPNANYEVRVTFFGANTAATPVYAFRVVDASRTVNGCTIRIDNAPANTKIAWVVQALPTA